TTTFEGGSTIAGVVTENGTGTGPIPKRAMPQLAGPPAYWFGFLQTRAPPAGPGGANRGRRGALARLPPLRQPRHQHARADRRRLGGPERARHRPAGLCSAPWLERRPPRRRG